MAHPSEFTPKEFSPKNILPLLKEVTDVFHFGVYLGISTNEIERIEKEHKDDVRRQVSKVILFWMKNFNDCSWKTLAKAVKDLGTHGQLASRLSKMDQTLTADDNVSMTSGVEGFSGASTNSGCNEETLREFLECLLKMGFNLDDIQKWVEEKKAATSPPTPPLSRLPSTNGNPSSESIERQRKRKNTSQGNRPRSKRSRSEGFDPTRKRHALIHHSSIDGGTRRQRKMQMKDDMMMILEALENEESAEAFVRPVDEEVIEDYYDEIKNPMCLNKMKRKVTNCEYNTRKEFCKDFDLIVQNCHEYNGEDSEYTKEANVLEEKFNELLSNFLPDDKYSDPDSPLKKLSSDDETLIGDSQNKSETSIGGEPSTTRRRTSSHRRLKSIRRQKDMQTILTELKDEKSAEEFINPVDKERAEDYYEHIDKPMWLNEMKRKVEHGDYSNMKQFCDDFELIIKNCHDYNAPDHEVIEQADQLKKRFCKLIEDLSDESDSDSSLEKLPSDAKSSYEEHEDSEQSDHSEEDSNSEASEDNDASLDISYSCPTEEGDD